MDNKTQVFDVVRDLPCRTTIIRALTDRPVAYEGDHAYENAIMVLTIPDTTKRFLLELWGENP